MDEVKIQPIMEGKDRVVLHTIDGQTMTGVVMTMKLLNLQLKFMTDDEKEMIIPLSSIETIEKVMEH